MQLDAAAAPRAACTSWDIDYKLSAKLKLSDTPLNAGDGIHDIGPGAITLRFENDQGRPGGKVQLRSYQMREHYTLFMRALFTNTTLAVRADTRIAAGECASAAEGSLSDKTLSWLTPISGYRTAGKVTCTGFLCGKPGVPPAGVSELRIEPDRVRLETFEFSKDSKTWTMDYGFAIYMRKPKQVVHIALRGRELQRRCITPPTCG